MRATRAQKDAAAELLRQAYAEEQLTREELENRTAVIYAEGADTWRLERSLDDLCHPAVIHSALHDEENRKEGEHRLQAARAAAGVSPPGQLARKIATRGAVAVINAMIITLAIMLPVTWGSNPAQADQVGVGLGVAGCICVLFAFTAWLAWVHDRKTR